MRIVGEQALAIVADDESTVGKPSEAMGLPVIALESGGAPEVVEQGVTGLLSQPGDIEALSEHLLDLLRDAGRRAAMGAEGRRRVEAHFTAPRMAHDVGEVYKWLISPRC